MRRAQLIPVLSLVFTAAFFLEYTPVLPQVHIPYDLEDYHYPLADYAFQAIRAWAISAMGSDHLLRDKLRRQCPGRAVLSTTMADVHLQPGKAQAPLLGAAVSGSRTRLACISTLLSVAASSTKIVLAGVRTGRWDFRF